MAKEFPQIKKKDQGKFTAWAKRNGFKEKEKVPKKIK